MARLHLQAKIDRKDANKREHCMQEVYIYHGRYESLGQDLVVKLQILAETETTSGLEGKMLRNSYQRLLYTALLVILPTQRLRTYMIFKGRTTSKPTVSKADCYLLVGRKLLIAN